jgi:hypothetical protein
LGVWLSFFEKYDSPRPDISNYPFDAAVSVGSSDGILVNRSPAQTNARAEILDNPSMPHVSLARIDSTEPRSNTRCSADGWDC